MKIVINTSYGGFSLSDNARAYMGWTKQEALSLGNYENRNNPDLIKCVEELGEAANGEFSKLKIVEIPDDVDWVIENYDGVEWVSEKHRVWY